MWCLEPINQLHIPLAFGISVAPRNPIDPLTISSLHRKSTLDSDFRDPITINIRYCLIHYGSGVTYDHVRGPGRIFVPYEFRIACGVRYHIQQTVTIKIGHLNCVSTAILRNIVRLKCNRSVRTQIFSRWARSHRKSCGQVDHNIF